MLAILGLILVIVITFWIQYEVDDEKKRTKDKNESKARDLRNEFRKKGDLKYFAYFENSEYFAIVDNYLHVNIGTLKGKTNIDYIMATEIKYQISEKNKLRFVSIMPTYDKYTKLVAIELILYRRGKEDVNFILDAETVSEQKIKKLKMILDEMIKGRELNA